MGFFKGGLLQYTSHVSKLAICTCFFGIAAYASGEHPICANAPGPFVGPTPERRREWVVNGRPNRFVIRLVGRVIWD